ncbi:uncharacterized protein LOC114355193 [Ostrinia furnacalis]|uniref:uncharacterized protein LOC114355193 n=1 Tax=Ostrinia furnacalis TaxID=93504 RepID=UPI00103B74AB|nr:uncharacterized protein LOC114355193 [Ostrinia furnacalis]
MITTSRGFSLMMINEFTFYTPKKGALTWTCSSRTSGCPAKVKLVDDTIRVTSLEHNHGAPAYYVKPDGNYVFYRRRDSKPKYLKKFLQKGERVKDRGKQQAEGPNGS